jgi:hypothetical protein
MQQVRGDSGARAAPRRESRDGGPSRCEGLHDLVRMSADAVAVDPEREEELRMLPEGHLATLCHVIADEAGGLRVADWPPPAEVRAWRPRSGLGFLNNKLLFALRSG